MEISKFVNFFAFADKENTIKFLKNGEDSTYVIYEYLDNYLIVLELNKSCLVDIHIKYLSSEETKLENEDEAIVPLIGSLCSRLLGWALMISYEGLKA